MAKLHSVVWAKRRVETNLSVTWAYPYHVTREEKRDPKKFVLPYSVHAVVQQCSDTKR